jgi:hypothetical protein
MKVLGLDISMRSSGMYCDGEFKLIQYTTKQFNDELLFYNNSLSVLKFIEEMEPTEINIEGLSYNSISGEADKIAGNYWYIRTQIKLLYPEIKLNTLQVTEWRNPLFNKIERKQLADDKKKLKALKESMSYTKMSTKEKHEFAIANEDLILDCDIKSLTYKKLPDEIKLKIEKLTTNKSKFDCADAYFISSHN